MQFHIPTITELDMDRPVHLVGIGGAGMSAIANVLLDMGIKVTGSDIKESANVKRLRDRGAVIGIGHRPSNISSPSLVVRSSAVGEDNPEIVEAIKRGIPVITRAEMLAAIMRTKESIAVAGTHGKTTTTSLVAKILLDCGEDPAYLIGGELNETGGNARFGNGRFLVAEADESDGSLLLLEPMIAILTNVDADHLDYFKDVSHVAAIFKEFLRRLPHKGFAVVFGDDPLSRAVGEHLSKDGKEVIFYGARENNEFRFSDFVWVDGHCVFEIYEEERPLGKVRLSVPGFHNACNALGAFAVCRRLGLPVSKILKAIEDFSGVRRRFEFIGESKGIRVLDDYAHHPTEVKAVLSMAKEIFPDRLVVVFQPHRYSRTLALADDFGRCFEDADFIVVTDIYGADESPEPGVTGELIVESIKKENPKKQVVYYSERATLASNVCSHLRKGDTVITMGAGDITQCSREILENLQGMSFGA